MPKKPSSSTPSTTSAKKPAPLKPLKATKKKTPKREKLLQIGTPPRNFRLLALDQSSLVTGWAVLDMVEGQLRLSAYGILDISRDENRKKLGVDQRVPYLARMVGQMIDELKPTAVAMEMPFIGQNKQTGATLFRCFGAVEMLASTKSLPLFYCAPSEQKRFVLRDTPNWTKIVRERKKEDPALDKKLVKGVLSRQFNTPFCHPLGSPHEDICDDSDAVAVGVTVLFAIIPFHNF